MIRIIRKPVTLLLSIIVLASCIPTSYALRPMAAAVFQNTAKYEKLSDLIDIDDLWFDEKGPAAHLLELVGKIFPGAKQEATIFVTAYCPWGCKMCIAEQLRALAHRRKLYDFEKSKLIQTTRHLRGIPKLYYSGGEPSFYGQANEKSQEGISTSLSQDFIDIVIGGSDNVGELIIDTNGAFLLNNFAREQFLNAIKGRKNIALNIALEPNHEEDLGLPNLQEIVNRAEELTKQGLIKTKYFMLVPEELPGKKIDCAKEYIRTKFPVLIKKFSRYLMQKGAGNDEFVVSRYKTQGGGARLDRSKVKTLRIGVKDQIRHDTDPKEWFLFVDVYGKDKDSRYRGGEILNSDHIAFVAPKVRHKEGILGDLTEGTITDVIFEGLGKLIRFDLYPEFRYLLLSEFFKKIGDVENAKVFWDKAEEIHKTELQKNPNRPLIWVFDKLVFDTEEQKKTKRPLAERMISGNLAFIMLTVYFNAMVEGDKGVVERTLRLLDRDKSNTVWSLDFDLAVNLKVARQLMEKHPAHVKKSMERFSDQLLSSFINNKYGRVSLYDFFTRIIIGTRLDMDLEADEEPDQPEREKLYLHQTLNDIIEFFRKHYEKDYHATLPYYVGEENAQIFYERFMVNVEGYFREYVGEFITKEDFDKYKSELKSYFKTKPTRYRESLPGRILSLFPYPKSRYTMDRHMHALIIPEYFADLLHSKDSRTILETLEFISGDEGTVWREKKGFFYHFMLNKRNIFPLSNKGYPYILTSAMLDVVRNPKLPDYVREEALKTAVELGTVIKCRLEKLGNDWESTVVLWSRKIVSKVFQLLISSDRGTRRMAAKLLIEMMSIWQGHPNGWERYEGPVIIDEFYRLLNRDEKDKFVQIVDMLNQKEPVKNRYYFYPADYKQCIRLLLELAKRSNSEIEQYVEKNSQERSDFLWSLKLPDIDRQKVDTPITERAPINWERLITLYKGKSEQWNDSRSLKRRTVPDKVESNSELAAKAGGWLSRLADVPVPEKVLKRILYLFPQQYNGLGKEQRRDYLEIAEETSAHISQHLIWAYGDGVVNRKEYEILIELAKDFGLTAKDKPLESFKTGKLILEPELAKEHFDLKMIDIITRFPKGPPTGQLRYRKGKFVLADWPTASCLSKTNVYKIIDTAA